MARDESNPQRVQLATFLHISDLHIGLPDPATGDAEMSWPAVQAYSNMPWLDGLLGHHGKALEELDSFVADLKQTEPEMRLIVSGDLSRFGGAQELKLARAYIERKINIRPRLQVGLAMGKQLMLIPGNHDQWGGTPNPFGIHDSNFYLEFNRKTPFFDPVDLPKVGKRLVFISVDSDADVTKLTSSRVRAVGKFDTQLASLYVTLPPKPVDDIRVLLIHHSWVQPGFILRRMSISSKLLLNEFMCSNNISVLLCGHSHETLLQRFEAKSRVGACYVHELRAASASQHDVVPYMWKTLLRNRPIKKKWNPNAVLVHRIYQKTAAAWNGKATCTCAAGKDSSTCQSRP